MFPTDYAIAPTRLAREAEARGLGQPVLSRTYAHSRQQADAVSRRWRPAPSVLARPRSLRRPRRLRGGDGKYLARYRHLPRHRARPDHPGQGNRFARHDIRRARDHRHRRRMEPGRNGKPRRRVQGSVEDRTGESAGRCALSGRRTSRNITGSTSISIRSGPGPSPFRPADPPSGLGPTRGGFSIAWRSTGTAGCPSEGRGSGNMARLTKAMQARGRDMADFDLALFGFTPGRHAMRGTHTAGVQPYRLRRAAGGR